MAVAVFLSPAAAKQSDKSLNVFVSIIPQAYFVERIGGQRVSVEILVGEGQSPHTYEPSPRQMSRLTRADAYFAIGVPFEKNMIKKIKQAYKKLIIIETQKDVTYRQMDDDHHNHKNINKKDAGTHHGKIPDPHIWMDPKLVKIQARNIHNALCRLDPDYAVQYSNNLNGFLADLDRTDKHIASVLAPLKGSNMFVFHPAFGYFADSYGLHQISIEISGKEPSAKQLATIIDKAKKDGAHIIFVQPQFSRKSADTIAKAISGAVIPINPLALDYLANLEQMADKIEKGLRRQ